MENKLWYSAPAKNWNEALPLGNGQLGAMVFGNAECEHFSLNHDTLWSGTPKDKAQTDLSEYFKKSVNAAMNGDYPLAQQILEQHICTEYDENYMPMGDLLIKDISGGKVTEYERSLDLDNACSTVKFSKNGVSRTSKAFISAPDNAFVLYMSADKADLNLQFSLTSLLQGNASLKDNCLVFTGECPSHVEPNYVESDTPVVYEKGKHGVGFSFGITVITDGEKSEKAESITVSSAKEITVFLTASTSFVDYKTEPFDPNQKYLADCISRLKSLENSTVSGLFEKHVEDYQQLEQRCKLDLSSNKSLCDIPTDERLRRFKADPTDFGLYELLFRYGRYLLISSSRPNTQPANLQGIWNELLRAPWSSNYTVNINTEMNYWPVFMTNLTECSLPLIELVRDLSITGKSAAKNLYGAGGYTAHHNTDLWRASNAVGNHSEGCACYGYWPMSAAWLCRHVYEYYEFTGDTEFLKSTALPLMKGAAEFIISILQEDENGELIICPSTSPENTFIRDSGHYSVSKSSAMSQAIACDLLANCQAVCKLTGESGFAEKLELSLKKLKPIEIGKDGRIIEWHEEELETDPHHRHISHLYALHPAQLIDIEKTPQLAKACEKSLNTRGDTGTGWSLAWKVNQWARLHDGERALQLIDKQLILVESDTNISVTGGGTYSSFLCAHPPFQIDGNFGVTSGIAEMLLQSDSETITLLPALPKAWANGNYSGGLARGGYCVSLSWENGSLVNCEITASKNGNVKVKYNGAVKELDFESGQTMNIGF